MSIDQRRPGRHFHEEDFDPAYHLYDPAAQPQMPRPNISPAKPFDPAIHPPMVGRPRPVRRPIMKRGGR